MNETQYKSSARAIRAAEECIMALGGLWEVLGKDRCEGLSLLLKQAKEDLEAYLEACARPRTSSCWQCSAPLGSTPQCMTCAAKRREEIANNPHVKAEQQTMRGGMRLAQEEMAKSPLLRRLNRGSGGEPEELTFAELPSCDCRKARAFGFAAACSQCAGVPR